MAWTVAPSLALQLIAQMSMSAQGNAQQHQELQVALTQVQQECIVPAQKKWEEDAKKREEDAKKSPEKKK